MISQTILTLGALAVPALAQVSCTLQPEYAAPVTSNGWSAQLVAQDLDNPRGILFDSEGNLLVIDRSEGIVRMTFEDGGGTCLNVANKTTIVDSDTLNHGIAISEDSRTLYASDSNSVYSWTYDPATGSISSSNQTLITNMASEGHVTRTLMMSQVQPGMLVVSRGSDENLDVETQFVETGRSQIRAFNVTNLTSNAVPYDYSSDGVRLGWGLRNSVGVAEDPTSGAVYSVENSVDEASRSGVDIHTNNPGEELNFHGYLSDTSPRGNYGYPHCFAVWSTDIPDLDGMTVGSQFALDQNSTINDEYCEDDTVAPRLTFQAHTAPLDIIFQPNGSEAYVSFHGSWNRDAPVGYTINSIPFTDGSPSAKASTTDSSRVIISNPDNSACPDGCFRPVGLAIDAAGRLWFSSDSTGELYVMAKTGPDTAPPPTTTTDGGVPVPAGTGAASPSSTENSVGRMSPGVVSLVVVGAAVGFAFVI